MYVTFLYELDRSGWAKHWQRDFASYIEKFEGLLQTLRDAQQKLLVFGDDSRIASLVSKYSNATYLQRPLSSFYWQQQQSKVSQSMLNRYMRFNIPEYFSSQYVCLQLCKFEALRDASLLFDNEESYRWIDAGVRGTAQYNWDRAWRKQGVHVCCTAPPLFSEWLITEAPVQTVVGGCFGAKTSADAQWLYEKTTQLEEELLSQGKHANDQVLLSILLHRYDHKFVVNRCYTQYIPFQILGAHVNWDRALLALHEDEDDFVDYRMHVLLAIALIVCLLNI